MFQIGVYPDLGHAGTDRRHGLPIIGHQALLNAPQLVSGGPSAGYARAPEPEDLVRICRALNAARARYVLIGGFAVLAHGASRFTKDIDFLVDDAPENVALVKQGLAILADNAAAEVIDRSFLQQVLEQRRRP